MGNITIGDLFLGYNDGLEEWSKSPDLNAYFYNHEHLIERAQNPERWLFLGKKGTGKSLLGAYLVEALRTEHGLSELCSYKDFQIHQLEDLKSTDVAPNQYISIWRWILLVQFGKLLRENQGLIYNPSHTRLCSFFDKNFPERPIDAAQVLEITKTRKFVGALEASGFKIGSEGERSSKETTAEYNDYLSDLEDVVVNLIAASEVPYLVVIDELDHRFRRSDLYHDSITGLIYAAARLNRRFYLTGRKSKIAVMMRTDICNWLNDVDINKIKGDPQIRVEIDWGNTETQNSALFDLVLHKINASLGRPGPHSSNRNAHVARWFPDEAKKRREKKQGYLLRRTLLRPRDLITFLNLARDEYKDAAAFSSDVLWKAETRYSSYFLAEFKNQLKGHIPDESIDLIFRLLSRIGQRSFLYSEFDAYCQEDRAGTNSAQLLEDMFEFSIVGNGYYDQSKRMTRQRWAYRTHDVGLTKVDLDVSMHIHPGLWKALGMA